MGAAEILNLDLGGTVLVDDLEWPRLHILLDSRVIEPATDETPDRKYMLAVCFMSLKAPQMLLQGEMNTYLTSKTVLRGFMAAWFLAASPINRSFSVKETKDGVVKLPCSLAMISTLFPSYVATQE